MFQLHIANKNYSSWSLRPWILLRQLGVPFVEHLESFAQGGGSNWQNFRRFSPSGKVPTLHADGHVVWDSLAIAEFVAERFPAAWPADPAARAWARSATAEMHSGFATLREQCSMNCSLEIELHEITDALRRDLDRLEELWTEGLLRFGGPFLAGKSFTIVDAFFCPVAIRIRGYRLQLSDAAMAYAGRLLELPAMQEWMADGIREEVEPSHESDCLKYGKVIASKR